MEAEPPSLSFLLTTEPTGLTLVLGHVVLVLLFVCSALISGSEVALFSLTKSDIEPKNKGKESKKQAVTARLLSRPKKLLATILVANNTVNIAIVLLFESLSSVWFENLSRQVDLYFFKLNAIFLVKVVIALGLILLLGEILPKIYASRNKLGFSLFMARPLHILDITLSPITRPMQAMTLYLNEKYGQKKADIDVDKLSHALELTSDEDTTHQEQDILKSIVSFGNTDIAQVMTPRMDIFALREDMRFEDIIPQIVEQGFSRIPVFKEGLDKITGILYVKDLIPYLNSRNFNWQKTLREPYFVPDNKKLDDLLGEFKEKKVHLAIVVDEYGGTSGLISLEDIIEEIVGDISDEFDEDELTFSKIDERTFIFEGKTPLKDFYRAIRLEDPVAFEERKGEAETVAGFLLEISGGFPKKGQVIWFHQYAFKVEAFEGKRISQIKLSIT